MVTMYLWSDQSYLDESKERKQHSQEPSWLSILVWYAGSSTSAELGYFAEERSRFTSNRNSLQLQTDNFINSKFNYFHVTFLK